MTVVADVHVHPGGSGQSLSDREHPMIAVAGHVAVDSAAICGATAPAQGHWHVPVPREQAVERCAAGQIAGHFCIWGSEMKVTGIRADADSLHRLVKHAIDSGAAESVETAEALFLGYRLGIEIGADAAGRPADQAALLTAVAVGSSRLSGRGLSVGMREGSAGGPVAPWGDRRGRCGGPRRRGGEGSGSSHTHRRHRRTSGVTGRRILHPYGRSRLAGWCLAKPLGGRAVRYGGDAVGRHACGGTCRKRSLSAR